MLIEIKARFDESANIAWARTLENAGCHVMYGMLGPEDALQAVPGRARGGRRDTALRPRRDRELQPDTARIYEDIGLLTADPEVGAEVSSLFNYITGYSRDKEYRCMIVAPQMLRTGMIELIQREADAATPESPGHHQDEQPLRRGRDRCALRRIGTGACRST